MKLNNVLFMLSFALVLTACRYDSDANTERAQEVLLAEGVAQTGMPAIKNFRERKLLKDILELRDQDGLLTYTYMQAEMSGELVFLCNSFGYGIPAATQYTNPQKVVYQALAIPQAELVKAISVDNTFTF